MSRDRTVAQVATASAAPVLVMNSRRWVMVSILVFRSPVIHRPVIGTTRKQFISVYLPELFAVDINCCEQR